MHLIKFCFLFSLLDPEEIKVNKMLTSYRSSPGVEIKECKGIRLTKLIIMHVFKYPCKILCSFLFLLLIDAISKENNFTKYQQRTYTSQTLYQTRRVSSCPSAAFD